ncbi:hypothetical protein DFQ28_006004 [Apophysomyces sp. BC1034]|nr:hypothetical protein DFQ30_000103 [Apophysomyces sp. BC1015]KAG0182413.1 hypothetical protein DFQ29_004216 [Apophysomyces sp. BC1021]KAG0193223.1 hypothetical protein DFQ28_006004 [Apophysomyces sp. BC1034]
MACRSKEKTERVVEEIKRETGNPNVEFIQLDLLSLKSVKEFVDEFSSRHDKLHILLNNAGLMLSPFGLSEDNIEIQFATNHVGQFYLTTLLLPFLERTVPSRIVNVSSIAHNYAWSLDLDTINNESGFNSTLQYSRTKACNILFARELNRRLQKKGVEHVYVNSNHPGVVRSELTRHMLSPGGVLNRIYDAVFTIPTEDGALTQLFLATSPEVEEKKIRDQYYVPYARPGTVRGVATSSDKAVELWEYTEKLLQEKIPEYKGAGI